VAAVDLCGRCGRFVCGDCAVLRGETSLCLECSGKPVGASTRAIAALVVALVGFVLCGPASIVAIALGRVEQRAIERHEAPKEGLSTATWAVRLGLVQLALLGIGIGSAVVLTLI
jgi:hypothetical protein